MKSRIAIWAAAGALVVVLWSLYISTTHSNPLAAGGAVWAFICLTCPIALASHHAMSFYLVLLTNAATYALVGFLVEATRRHFKIRTIAD
jgi:hypothetical protein